MTPPDEGLWRELGPQTLARLVRTTPPQVATFLAASDAAFDASAARPDSGPQPRREPDPRGQAAQGRARPAATRAVAEG